MTGANEEFQKESELIVSGFRKEMNGIRTNRPSPALVENISVSCYGRSMLLKQIGSIGVVPPREIIIQVWDKGTVSSVVKAIDSASIGLSASIDGNTIRLRLPELNRERREELIKHAGKLAEQYRIQVRHLRDEANRTIQKLADSHEINEDQKFKLREEIQKQTDAANHTIEDLLKRKIEEIMD